MKTKNITFALLATVLVATGVQAQISQAQWRIYPKGSTNYSFYTPNNLESIRFTDSNNVVNVLRNKKVGNDGQWRVTVYVNAGFSIGHVLTTIVSAETPDSLIESLYKSGRLQNLRECRFQNRQDWVEQEFVVECGEWKPVAFSFDANGNYLDYQVSYPVTVSDDFVEELNSNMIQINLGNSDRHFDWGYPSLMHIRDVMGEEYLVTESGYAWFNHWAENNYMGNQYVYAAHVWRFFDTSIRQINKLMDTMIMRGNKADVSAAMATAYAHRALLYLDAARMYEYLPTDGTNAVNEYGHDVTGLTYPIATSQDSIVQRATRQDMALYILTDLDRAEEMLMSSSNNKTQVSLAAIYGMRARTFMWTENYDKAKTWATKAIQAGGHTPLTRNEWLSTTRGFNDSSVSSWMWALNYPANSDAVASGIVNWTSFCSNEFTGGYAFVGPYPLVGKSFYDRIADSDFRKLSFKAPGISVLSGQEEYINIYNFISLPRYSSLKFRPGQGVTDDFMVSCAVDVPLMRIEEMYFIQMEAEAQLGNTSKACALLNTFMQLRNPGYQFTTGNKDALIEEIFFQKRVELWGEGLNFFDYKRLNRPVTRDYAGTNFPRSQRFNTTSRPAWMNFVFVRSAYNGKLEEWNNPDPSNCYISE